MCFPVVKTVKAVNLHELELADGQRVIGDPGTAYNPGDKVEVMGQIVVQKILET